MTPKIPMEDDEIKMHKPVCAEFVDFRAGIRCAERVYDVAKLLAQIERITVQYDLLGDQIERTRAERDQLRAEIDMYKNRQKVNTTEERVQENDVLYMYYGRGKE